MRILGIDVGSSSIKAVELDSAFGRYEINDYHEVKRAPGAEASAEISQLVASLPRKPDKVAVAMRTGQVTFRNLQLPTRDKKAIQAGVGFELEDELPFALESSVYDYTVVGQLKQASTVHVAATLKRHALGSLGTWLAAGLDPDVVTTEAWAYRTLMNRVLGSSQEQPVLLAHIGHERTVLYLHWRGTPILAREVNWGGRDLTTAICQKYHIPVDQAEAAKLDHGFVIPDSQKAEATPEQIEFSDSLSQPLQALIGDLRQAELTCKNTTQQHLGQIYVTGGTSQLPGLVKVLEESLMLPVKPLQGLSSVATSGVTYSEQADASCLLAASLALCLVGADRAGGISFRKGELAKQGKSRELNLAALRKPLTALGAVLACLFASLIVQSSVYKSRLQETDTQLERSIKSFFGAVSTSAVHTYMNNTSTLRSSVNKDLAKQRELGKLLGPNPHSPIEFLKTISAAIPKDVVVDMTQYQVGASPTGAFSPDDTGTAALTFLITTPQAAEKLARILGSKLSALQQGKPEETAAPDGSKRWKVTFSGKPTEDSYGK